MLLFWKQVNETEIATLVNTQPDIYYQNYPSFYPSEPFTLDHINMRHPVMMTKNFASWNNLTLPLNDQWLSINICCFCIQLLKWMTSTLFLFYLVFCSRKIPYLISHCSTHFPIWLTQCITYYVRLV